MTTGHKFKVGDRVTLPADPIILGTEETPAVVVSLESYGYRVETPDEWVGPVDFELNALQEH